MTDPKNIVIKVKCTTPNAAAEPPASTARMVTEWNVKRIAGAVSVLSLLIAALLFLLNRNSEPESVARNATLPASAPPTSESSASHEDQHSKPKPTSQEAAPSPVKQAARTNPSFQSSDSAVTNNGGRVRRAVLAYRIVDKEPADLIEGKVGIGNRNPVQIYYFTEVRGKTAQVLFHEWLKDGRVVMRHPVAIAADRWRTSSQRELGRDDLGNWSVRTLDNKGTVMNEIHFTVSMK